MSYTALARTWRPKTFAELAGQEHVLRALTNALNSGRVHHAFLFTGTRGVGKTTIARILAKCLNCETNGVSATPCGTCAACREIDEGRFIDLVEVDAASRTKVDDTRELLDNVQYSPTRGRYKVYLIDEVHMLSSHSFNALLKTLEEPPPHVKFLLATTDPQKLPVTVLSRCLQFNLKRLPVGLIADRMTQILASENVPHDAAGVRLIAQAADGSMRDGLSLLDQLIAFGGGKVDESGARAMLGTLARDHVVKLAELLAALDPPAVLAFAGELEQWSPDYAQVLDELAGLLVRVALKQVNPAYTSDEIYDEPLIAKLATAMSREDVQLFYQTAIIGRRDLTLAPEPRLGFEMTLIRMLAFRPAGADAGQGATGAAAGVDVRARQASPAVASSHVTPAAAPVSSPSSAPASVAQTGAAQPSAPQESATAGDWTRLIVQLELGGAARQLASHCAWLGKHGAVVRLALAPRHQSMRTSAQEDKLAQALSRHYGERVVLEFEMREHDAETPALAGQRAIQQDLESARQSLESDPTVVALKERFGATLHPETVRPMK